ncbi:MAG: hypothetical protein RSA24_02790, partial [Clostridia bacterium]
MLKIFCRKTQKQPTELCREKANKKTSKLSCKKAKAKTSRLRCGKAKRQTSKLSLASVISFATNSLLSKKLRTSLSVVASSVGILGVALILSLTNGVSKYIKSVEAETVSSAPVTISAFGRTESKTTKQTTTQTKQQIEHATAKQQTENATTKQQITPQIKPQTNPNTVLPTDGN